MIRTSIVTLLLLVGSAGVLSGQARSSEPGPVGTLLDLRETLALSSQQISRLEQIDAEMDEQNRPLVRQLAEIRRQIRALGPRSERTDEQRARFEAFVDEARPLMRQIEENNRAAMKRVGRVLTKAQKAQVKELIRDRGDRRGNDDSRRGSNHTRPGDL